MLLNSDETAKPKGWGKNLRYITIAAALALSLWLVLILGGRLLGPAAIKQIAGLTQTQITAQSVHMSFTGAARLKNLSITPKGHTTYDNTFFTADTVYVRFGLGSILTLKPKVKEIKVKNFILNALYDTDSGRWNLGVIRFTGTGGKFDVPEIELKNGLVKYGRIVRSEVQPVMEMPLELTMEKRFASQGWQFAITTGDREFGGSSVLNGSWKGGKITVSGGISSGIALSFEKLWSVNTVAGEMEYGRDGSYTLKVRIKDFQYSSKQSENVPLNKKMFPEGLPLLTYLKNFFEEYGPEGKIDIESQANGNFYKMQESKLWGAVYCKGVSVCNIDFPYALEHIRGKIDFTENSYKLNELRGNHKDSVFLISGWEKDFGATRKYDFLITSEAMSVDKDLYDALNSGERKMWNDFDPNGKAALNYTISRSSATDKKTRIEIILQSAKAKCRYFPYPLKNLFGKIIFEGGNVIFSDIVSQTGQSRITINGQVENRRSARPGYNIKINAEGVPLDEELTEALPERQRLLWRNLNLGGVVDSDIEIRAAQSTASGFAADISIKKGELKAHAGTIDSVIKDISVQATLTADMVHIEELKGKYGSGTITLGGQVWPAESALQSRYRLALFAEQVELDDAIINLMARQQREIAAALKPRGKVNISANFDKDSGQAEAKYKVSVNCMSTTASVDKIGCDLKDIWGDVRIANDRITLDGITANTAGRDRMTDAPAMTINGEATIRDAEMTNTKILDFSGDILFNDCDLDEGGKLTEISGLLKLTAAYDSQAGLYRGQADFNASRMKIDDKLLTNVNAFIGYEPKEQSWASKNLIADCYDGKLTGKLAFKPSYSGSEYTLQAAVNNIDLRKFLEQCRGDYTQQSAAAENGSSNGTCTSGKMSGSLNVTGRLGSAFPTMGRCKLEIREMQVGKMSLLAKILSVLKLSAPEDYAFDRMLIDSYIESQKLHIEKIDLSGRTLAFNGSGLMDLESRNISVTLTARGQHITSAKPSILQSLTDALSPAVVRIDISGDFYDPKVETTTLPILTDPLGILGSKEPAEKK